MMEKIIRGTVAWNTFVSLQKEKIERRLERYNNIKTVKEQLLEVGRISNYQDYKIKTVTPFLRKALQRIDEGAFGFCEVCGKEISIERLRLVPGALAHVACDSQKKEVQHL